MPYRTPAPSFAPLPTISCPLVTAATPARRGPGWTGAVAGFALGLALQTLFLGEALHAQSHRAAAALARVGRQAESLTAALGDAERRLRPTAAVEPSVAPSTPSAAASPAVEPASALAVAPPPGERARIATRVAIPRRLLLGRGLRPHNARVVASPRGIRVYGVRPRSLWARLGLANGDLIERIDGTRLDSPHRGLAIYQRLLRKRSFAITIVRAGLRQKIVVHLRDAAPEQRGARAATGRS